MNIQKQPETNLDFKSKINQFRLLKRFEADLKQNQSRDQLPPPEVYIPNTPSN